MQSVLNFFTGIWLSVVNAMVGWSPASRNKAAHLLAWLFWHVVPKRRKVALTNLKLCFPNWTESKRQEIAKQCFYRLARAALDHSVLWKGSAEQVRNFVRFDEGVVERITSTENRPLIVIAPHFAGLDASGIGLNLFVRGVSLYQRQSNPVWDKAALEGRKRFSDPILIAKGTHHDLRPIIRAMREGLPFYYLPDMDHGRRNSIFVPFFGVPAATLPMASEEGLSKIRELVAEHVDTSKYKIYEVEWFEDNRDRQLENILTYIDVYYIDADNNNYHLAFQLTDGKFTTDGPEQNDRQTNSYACSTPLDLAAIDFDYLQKIGEKADALVMSDEEGKNLTLKSAGMFRFRVWPVSLSDVERWNRSEEFRAESEELMVQFELNYVDESESPEYQGRFTVTNYYTVAFTADAAGEVAIDD